MSTGHENAIQLKRSFKFVGNVILCIISSICEIFQTGFLLSSLPFKSKGFSESLV